MEKQLSEREYLHRRLEEEIQEKRKLYNYIYSLNKIIAKLDKESSGT